MGDIKNSPSSEDSTTQGPAPSEIKPGIREKKKRGSDVSLVITFLLGVITTALFYLVIFQFKGTYTYTLFCERSLVQHLIVGLLFWSFWMLLLKAWKLFGQRKALSEMELICERYQDVSIEYVDDFTRDITSEVKNPGDKIIVQRFMHALNHFKSSRNTQEVTDALRYYEDLDTAAMESSFVIVKVFAWAIPILGFIGTVLGVSVAVGGFAKFIQTVEHLDEVKAALGAVTTGLAVAFDTTLLGLMTVVPLMFLSSFCQKLEDDFLISVDEFCLDNLISRLKGGRASLPAFSEGFDAQELQTVPRGEFDTKDLPALRLLIEGGGLKEYGSMLQETFQAFVDNFQNVVGQFMERVEIIGDQFRSFQPMALDIINAFDGFVNSSYGVFTDLLHQQGNFTEHVKSMQAMVNTMNEISDDFSKERQKMIEQGDRWVQMVVDKYSETTSRENKALIDKGELWMKMLTDEISDGFTSERKQLMDQGERWVKMLADVGSAIQRNM